MSDIPKDKFTDIYYDENYYASREGKAFQRPNGNVEHWGYHNPTGEWAGIISILESFMLMFDPKTMLDVGCGRGTFVAYARDFEIQAEGFDFSEWAVAHPYPRCKPEWIKRHDATQPWQYKDKQFDLVIALDFFEHLYEEDNLAAANELFRVANKWVFLQIATMDDTKEKPYKLKKGEPVPVELEGYAAAGHVNVQTDKYWITRLERKGWKYRPDLTKQFFELADDAAVANWKLNTVLVYERVNEE